MAQYNEIAQMLSERELSSILKILPSESFKPFDPTREANKRILTIDLPPYTSLYIFRDNSSEVKVYSSAEMQLISKATLLAYIGNDIALERLKITLERHTYPMLELPNESFECESGEFTSEILDLVRDDEENFNVLQSVFGETLPLTFNKELVNFVFLKPITGEFALFNNNPGLHHTLGLGDAQEIVLNFNPLLALQNDPESFGAITLPFSNHSLHTYLKSVLMRLNKPFTYNLHTARDYYGLLKYLLSSESQINEKLLLISIEKQGRGCQFLIGFKSEINSLKKRSVAAHLNELYLENYSMNENLKSYEEQQFNFDPRIKGDLFGLKTEIQGDNLRVQGFHTISLYATMIELFFGSQPVETRGVTV